MAIACGLLHGSTPTFFTYKTGMMGTDLLYWKACCPVTPSRFPFVFMFINMLKGSFVNYLHQSNQYSFTRLPFPSEWDKGTTLENKSRQWVWTAFWFPPFRRLVPGGDLGLAACPLIQMTRPTAEHTRGTLLQSAPLSLAWLPQPRPPTPREGSLDVQRRKSDP